MFNIEIDWASMAHLLTHVAITIAVVAIVIFAAGVLLGWALANRRRPAG
jgi:hypothetical protein